MTLDERRIERAAEAYERTLGDLPISPSDMVSLSEIRSTCLRAAVSAYLGDDSVVVPRAALDWLFGEAPDANGKWFGETSGEGVPKIAGKYPRTYWWRSEFRAMLSAAARGGE